MTKEEYNQAVMDAIDKTFQKANQSKESAIKFLKELGVIEEDKSEAKIKSLKRKSR